MIKVSKPKKVQVAKEEQPIELAKGEAMAIIEKANMPALDEFAKAEQAKAVDLAKAEAMAIIEKANKHALDEFVVRHGAMVLHVPGILAAVNSRRAELAKGA